MNWKYRYGIRLGTTYVISIVVAVLVTFFSTENKLSARINKNGSNIELLKKTNEDYFKSLQKDIDLVLKQIEELKEEQRVLHNLLLEEIKNGK